MDSTLLSLILPEGLSDYFEFDNAETVSGSTYLYLIEKNIHPQEFSGEKLLSKGFFDEVSDQTEKLGGDMDLCIDIGQPEEEESISNVSESTLTTL